MKFCAEIDLKVIRVVQHIEETAPFFKLRNAERTAKRNMLLERCIWTFIGCQTIQISPFNKGKHQTKPK